MFFYICAYQSLHENLGRILIFQEFLLILYTPVCLCHWPGYRFTLLMQETQVKTFFPLSFFRFGEVLYFSLHDFCLHNFSWINSKFKEYIYLYIFSFGVEDQPNRSCNKVIVLGYDIFQFRKGNSMVSIIIRH